MCGFGKCLAGGHWLYMVLAGQGRFVRHLANCWPVRWQQAASALVEKYGTVDKCAFARVRGAKYCTNLHVVRMWLAEAWGKPVSAGLVRSSVWQGFIDAARHCDTTLDGFKNVGQLNR